MSSLLVRFSGSVECRADRAGPLGLTLIGREGDEPVQVAFACPPGIEVPERLDARVVERTAPGTYRIGGERDGLVLDATRVFIHRDVTRAFYRAVPPRRAPLAKRAFWRAVLALAATRIGQRMLFAVRR
ncbi:MAG: hypothetical protein ACT4O5_01815 [Gammaproteobacteria bacterium]